MKAISLFSGCGGFEIGFDRAGIETVLQAESDPWCLSVLVRHWPDVERVTDVRSVRVGEPAGRSSADGLRSTVDLGRRETGTGLSGGVDLVYGGFPCQDLSVAGKRAGLSGERSGLWHEFHRVLSELRPRWTVIENVPGLLSSGQQSGADFGVLLRGLVDLGYGVAWRVLDARFFGVAQRRRRVFIVGCLGDARRAAQVLAVCESCGGHPAPRRETGEDVAPTLDDGARRASVELPMIAATQSGGGHANGVNLPGRHKEDDENLIAFHGTQDPISTPECRTALGGNAYIDVAGPMGVRRLPPLECERLQAWPDNWTKYTADGREIPDSHRYRMIGNGVVATVAEYIGHRLRFVDSMQRGN